MAYIGIGRVTKYYDLSSEAEVELTGDTLEPGDFVKIGNLRAGEYKIDTLTSGGKSVDILRVGQTGTINVNGEVLVNDVVYKNA